MLVLGKVTEGALKILGEYASKFIGLETLFFEECKDDRWSKESKALFVESFRKSEVLLDAKVTLIDNTNATFVKELKFYAEENRKKGLLKTYLEGNADSLAIEKQFACIM
jgi:hypothetical protein